MPGKIRSGDTEPQRRGLEKTSRQIARILYVAYPLLAVSGESAGGAEQILWALEREMSRRGILTTVAASAGSNIAGELFSTGEPCREIDDFERRNREHHEKIVDLIRRREREGVAFALAHDMSGSFWPSAADIPSPVLATLHLPRSFYQPHLFANLPPNVRFNCVSHSQARSFSDLKAFAGVVSNGIVLEQFEARGGAGDAIRSSRSGLLWLGRICEEKAPHLALNIADRARMPITIAGQVYPFSHHQKYFEREIAPRLRRMAKATFVESPSAAAKHRLLRQAQAVLITSQAEETSSLVAMEAVASGTPVIAFARGALPEVIQDGVTGFLVNNVEEAERAVQLVNAAAIDGQACLRYAREHFGSTAMAGEYSMLYARIWDRSCQARTVSPTDSLLPSLSAVPDCADDDLPSEDAV